MGRIRLALIAGGVSGEREVSLKGATEVEKALDTEKYEVVRYDPATDLTKIPPRHTVMAVLLILLHGIHG